ncbi:hypothetical protein ASF49_16085 [Methylobacterium sp. Leaf104]|uniref:hypothetical protein n=1 Tax=Methylobacterium TaxID=407 RepID=UPI000700A442|nr:MULTISPECIES: hypothetical protein [Methylobacterium]KQP29677.1 hypothetical protein ASF49_16085 [Methylobacterium sp. Leaf104]MCI9881775.1 hypothetical protein [Methylobacterium goesingense]
MQGSEPGGPVIRACVTALVALAVGLVALLWGCAAAGPGLGRPLLLALPAPFPPVRLLTPLIGLHLVGLCFGLGGATMLDFWILRWMREGAMPAEMERSFHFISKVVTMGIALLWISGLGFLGLYAIEAPEKLANPKLWAKVVVVAVLTVNGLLIHALVLPSVLRDVRRPMLDGVSRLAAGIFLVSGAVSGVSWYFAFALGLLREFNGRVSIGLLLALWGLGIVLATLGAFALRESLMRMAARRRARTVPNIEWVANRPGAPFSSVRLRRIPDGLMVPVRAAR